MDRKQIEISQEEIQKQIEYINQIQCLIGNKYKKYNIQTMGCALNENDSEKLSGMLDNMGYIYTDDAHEADIIIFNTCCVRENAEDKVFGKLGELKKKRCAGFASALDVILVVV